MSRALAVLAFAAATLPVPAAAQNAGRAPGRPLAPEVDSLVAEGRLQEAAWAARAAGDTARGEKLLERLEALLRATPLSARPLGMDSQGVSFTFRVEHPGGVGSLFKVDGSDIFCPSCGADREVAVYRIDRLLGADLTPMTLFHRVAVDGDTLDGSVMYFVEGARTAGADVSKPDRLRLFDAIIGNSDRHGANWLIRPDGSVVAIDHNRAFEYQPGTRPKTCWETEIDALAAPANLGPLYRRYRGLPADSLRAAVAGVLDADEAESFVRMRDRIVHRIDRRQDRPRVALPRRDCPSGP